MSKGTSEEIGTARPGSPIGSLRSTNAVRHIYHRQPSVIQSSDVYRTRSTQYKAMADERLIDILVKRNLSKLLCFITLIFILFFAQLGQIDENNIELAQS